MYTAGSITETTGVDKRESRRQTGNNQDSAGYLTDFRHHLLDSTAKYPVYFSPPTHIENKHRPRDEPYHWCCASPPLPSPNPPRPALFCRFLFLLRRSQHFSTARISSANLMHFQSIPQQPYPFPLGRPSRAGSATRVRELGQRPGCTPGRQFTRAGEVSAYLCLGNIKTRQKKEGQRQSRA